MSDLSAITALIPVLSLVVAALAVFFGPWVSWRIARRQIEASERVAIRQVVAPMRQAWINALRERIAEMLASTRHLWARGWEDQELTEYRRVEELEEEIKLMLNPNEEQHRKLLASIRSMCNGLNQGKPGDRQFIDAHERTTHLAQVILKAEWNRTKAGD